MNLNSLPAFWDLFFYGVFLDTVVLTVLELRVKGLTAS